MIYRITVWGTLDPSWGDWLGRTQARVVIVEGQPTTVQADVPDQSALLGLLNRLADMNLILLSVSLCTKANTNEDYNEAQ